MKSIQLLQKLGKSLKQPRNVNIRLFSSTEGKEIEFFFVEMKDPGVKIGVKGRIGESVMEVATRHNIDIEGACGGEMACSTCHVIIDQDLYDKLPSKKEEEQDMLDLTWGLQATSRLCCQIKVSEDIAGQTFNVPAEINSML